MNSEKSISVSIIGAGNVAYHLAKAFSEAKHVDLCQVYNRSEKALKDFNFTETTTDLDTLRPVDIYIIAISDDSISTFSQSSPKLKGLVVHTSGSKPMSVLDNNSQFGVFYPLQSFTKSKAVDLKSVPICIEASNEENLQLLETLGQQVSNSICYLNTAQREALHLSAVIVNNFTNYLYTVASDLCETHNVPFNLLHPLLLETAKKATLQSPLENQTGPAKRGDEKTIEKHLNQLEHSKYKAIYALLTKKITEHYSNGNEL